MSENTKSSRSELFPVPHKLRQVFNFIFKVGYQGDDKHKASRSLLLTFTLFLVMIHMSIGVFVQTGTTYSWSTTALSTVMVIVFNFITLIIFISFNKVNRILIYLVYCLNFNRYDVSTTLLYAI